MAVEGIDGAAPGGAGASGQGATSSVFESFDQDMFLKLFVAQLQRQTPFDVVETKDFVAQMAQFTAVESMVSMRASLDALAAQQGLAMASALIGQQVEALDLEGQPLVGVVEQVNVAGGTVFLQVDGVLVPLGDVQAVLPAP